MGASRGRNPGSTSRTTTYWPAGYSAVLLVTGGIVVLLETDSLLLSVGLVLIVAGVYGLFHRSKTPSRSTPDATKTRPEPGASPSSPHP